MKEFIEIDLDKIVAIFINQAVGSNHLKIFENA